MEIKQSCIWEDENQCENCLNKNRLHCRWRLSDLLFFGFAFFPLMLCVLAGTILIGSVRHIWWPALAYILFFPIVLGLAETRFLCSHCPYYNQKGIVLHCLANHGFIKIWRYRPEPMNKAEKSFMVILMLLLLILIPFSVLGYDIWYFAKNASLFGNIILASCICLGIITLFSAASFAFIMLKYFCKECVNFSCPFNLADKKQVDAFLLKNDVMRKAWEDRGYLLDEIRQLKK